VARRIPASLSARKRGNEVLNQRLTHGRVMEAQVQPSVIGTQCLPFEVVALALQGGGVTAPRICQMSAGLEGHGVMN
jgi:hypothetical protein